MKRLKIEQMKMQAQMQTIQEELQVYKKQIVQNVYKSITSSSESAKAIVDSLHRQQIKLRA